MAKMHYSSSCFRVKKLLTRYLLADTTMHTTTTSTTVTVKLNWPVPST